MSDRPTFRRRTVLGATGGLALGAIFGGIRAQHSVQSSPGDVESVRLNRIGRYETGNFDGGAEITAYSAAQQRLFVVNSGAGQIEVLDLSEPSDPTQDDVLDAAGDVTDGGGANSVDVVGRTVAVAVERTNPQEPGFVAFYNAASLSLLNVLEVGVLPDKVTITPDGNRVITANEGEPAFDETPGQRTDPGGSISVVDISDGGYLTSQDDVETLPFDAFDDQVESLREEGVRVYGASAEDTNPRPSTDFEPEFVTVTPDSETAFISLQENNAIATVDVRNAEIVDVSGLGFKDFSLPGNKLDTSDADAGDADAISLQNWPVKGMYQPDGIAAYEAGGETFLLTANEGDSRDFEEATVGDLTLATDAFEPRLSENSHVDSVEEMQRPEHLGNLEVTNQLGDPDGDGEFEDLYLFGARSFTVWKTTDDGLQPVYDSGDDFERIYARHHPAGLQNSTESGPETESVELGQVGDRTFAFVGIERGSAVFVYDVTAPAGAEHVQTVVNRDFSVGFGDLAADAEANPGSDQPGRAGDWGPEGIEFVPAGDSPVDNPLLVVGYEVSGTVAVFDVEPVPGHDD
ncbi:MAG: choice-of-anchor I family protein [Salinirussus sp.]